MTTVAIEVTLREGVSERGGWNRAQLAVLGIAWPPAKGWKAELIRKDARLSNDVHLEFLRLKT